MTAATLRRELLDALHEHAWEQWAQLGVSSAAPARREERAADPEALLLLTLTIGRSEPRLFDEVMDWMALNEPLISVHRLRRMCSSPADRALVDAALAWVGGVRRPKTKPSAPDPPEVQPLFPDLGLTIAAPDPAFAAHGLARPLLSPSRKSQPPRLHDPIAFALRLRRLLGVGVRAEVIRTLLTIRAPRLSGRMVTNSAGFASRNVRDGLTQLAEAGVLSVVDIADERHYAVQPAYWAALLELDGVPLHHDWIPAYRALRTIVQWLEQPGLAELSPYMLASNARSLMDTIADDLRYAGVHVGTDAARGADYWDEFTNTTRLALRNVRG